MRSAESIQNLRKSAEGGVANKGRYSCFTSCRKDRWLLGWFPDAHSRRDIAHMVRAPSGSTGKSVVLIIRACSAWRGASISSYMVRSGRRGGRDSTANSASSVFAGDDLRELIVYVFCPPLYTFTMAHRYITKLWMDQFSLS